MLRFKDENAFLPEIVRDWAGLNAQNPVFEIPDPDPYPSDENDEPTMSTDLAAENDGGASFGKIADYIEKYL
jgi:hypothetical protein